MAPSVLLPAGPPPGFPQCSRCPYVRTGPAAICVACARRAFDAIGTDACPVCSQQLNADGRCRNQLCHDPGRRISRIHAVAYWSGPLRRIIYDYKYEGATAWSGVFGRLLLGWLELHARDQPPHLIVANPTFTGPGGRRFAHVEGVLWKAAAEDAAITGAVRLQEDAGLRAATDGEFRREQWHADFLYAIPGIERGALGMPLPVYTRDGQITWTPNVTEVTAPVRLEEIEQHATADEITYLIVDRPDVVDAFLESVRQEGRLRDATTTVIGL